uniref:Uncharacterized protein n=1 Tax=Glossina palpalis gambiensis TaxID=67801 RepID=A0A1B0BI02_9MUSC
MKTSQNTIYVYAIIINNFSKAHFLTIPFAKCFGNLATQHIRLLTREPAPPLVTLIIRLS